MKNADKPINPQPENWQNDMEKHLADPNKHGHPSFEGIGLTKREYFAAMAMQGILSNVNQSFGIPDVNKQSMEDSIKRQKEFIENLINKSITYSDELLKQLDQ